MITPRSSWPISDSFLPRSTSAKKSASKGGITKCGNGHARWILIECATHYRYPPKISAVLAKRQVGRAKWIRDLAWRTQQRLHKRHRVLRICANSITTRAKVAVARELAAFLWELGTRIEAKSQLNKPPLFPSSFQIPRRSLGGL